MTDLEAIEVARCALGGQLATQRKAVGYTQLELAKRLGYSRSTIANTEKGRQHVPPEFWRRCDAILGAGGELVAAADDIEAMRRQHRRRISVEANAERETKAAAFRAAHEAALQSASALEPQETQLERDGRSAEVTPGHNLDGRSHFQPAEEDDVERRTLLQLLAPSASAP